MILCMFGTAITELFTGQWIDVLLKNVTDNALLILTLETGVMVVGRAFAGPVVKQFSPQGVLLMSAILASLGLYMLGHSTGNMIFVVPWYLEWAFVISGQPCWVLFLKICPKPVQSE